MVTIYHNPRCSKSRQTLQLLQDSNVDLEIVEYLENPMPEEVLSKALELFGDKAIRKGESDYKENIKPRNLVGKSLVEAMIAHPKTIERPLVVNGEKMALGRPPENVLEII